MFLALTAAATVLTGPVLALLLATAVGPVHTAWCWLIEGVVCGAAVGL